MDSEEQSPSVHRKWPIVQLDRFRAKALARELHSRAQLPASLLKMHMRKYELGACAAMEQAQSGSGQG